ncbi:hypothetical protein ACHWQZ_G008789 [Mnemiopsis leidyi]
MSSKRKKLSGAENRKRKLQELDLIAKIPSITSFGIVKKNSAPLAPSATGFSSAASANVATADVFWRDNDQVTDVTEQDPSFDLFSSDDEGTENLETETSTMTIDLAPVLDAYPSDKANFPTILTAADRRAVLSMEPCQPPELQQYYSLKQSNGIELKRSWLCFSPKLKQAYCVNCWLFARVNTPWATGVPHQKREGWLRRIEEHEKSACHKEAQRSRLQFSKAPIDGAIQQAIEDEENKCAAIISRVIDVLLACADMNIGLRGHREKIGDVRWNALKLDGDGLTVKKLCPTRWSSRFSSIRAVKDKQGAINRLLTKIVLMRQEGRDVAEGLLKRIRSFEFTATLVVWENILNKVDKVSNMLQTKDLDLAAVTTSLKSLVDHLTLLESDESFDTMMKTARAQAKLAGAEEDFTLSMARNLYRYTGRARHDGCDEPVSKEEIFKASVYLHSLRRCKEQAKLRFEGHFKVVNSFRCLLPKFISSCKLNDFREECVKLQSLYNKDLSSDFVEQLLDLKTDLREELLTASHSKELLELIFERQLQTLYPEVVTGLVLFLTLPVTVASAERSFSKLKLIKTYLRSTMSQDRLRHFALLSIEHKEAGKLDKSLIIKKFASAKVRRSKRFNVKLDL